jgi:hypothetical protein
MHGTGGWRVRTGDGRARCIADLSGNPRCGLLGRRVKPKQQKKKHAASGHGRPYKRTNRANVPSPCQSKTDYYACHIPRSPFMRELCFHAGRRRALISGCSRRLVLSGGATHRSEPSVRSTDINPQRLRSTQPISLSSTGIADRSGAARHFSTNSLRDLKAR